MWKKIIFWLVVAVALNGFCSDEILVPELDGEWWQIAESHPDVSPFNRPKHNACDFSIWQAADGTWMVASCIRGTSHPGATRLFHRWEAKNLTDTMWKPSTIVNTVTAPDGAVATVTNGIFAMSNPEIGQYEGVMQAPHCIKEDGKYYLYYNASRMNDRGGRQGNSAYCKVSDDGKTFMDMEAPGGGYNMFRMGRDLMIFRDDDGTYYSYFEAGGDMQYRTAQSLTGPWSGGDSTSLGTSGNPESPFVVKMGDDYYLWEHMNVFHSDSCDSFPDEPVTKMTPGWFQGLWAPEIILHEGQYYVFGYITGKGIWGGKMKWVERSWDDINAWRAEKSYVRPKK